MNADVCPFGVVCVPCRLSFATTMSTATQLLAQLEALQRNMRAREQAAAIQHQSAPPPPTSNQQHTASHAGVPVPVEGSSASLQQRVETFISTHRNKGTARAYANGWAGFSMYLQRRGVAEAAVTHWDVADYLRERVEVQEVAASTMAGDRAAIADHYRHAAPHLRAAAHGDVVKQMMTVLRQHAAPSKSKTHMSAELMRELIGAHDEAGPSGSSHAWLTERDICLMLLMLLGMLRESEAVALTLADVSVKLLRTTASPQGRRVLHVFIARSKTDQAQAGALVLLGANDADTAACPVRRLEKYLQVRKDAGVPGEALFPTVDGRHMAPNTPCGIVKKAVRLANGLAERGGFGANRWGDPDEYGSHSMRRGGVTTARLNGSSMLDIQRHGRWKSLTVFSYVGSTPQEQLAVTDSFFAGTSMVALQDEVPTAEAHSLRAGGRGKRRREKTARVATAAAATAAAAEARPLASDEEESEDESSPLEEALFDAACSQGLDESDDEGKKRRRGAARGAKAKAACAISKVAPGSRKKKG